MRELRDLRLNGLDDLGMSVAERRHGDAGAEVDQRVAVCVDDDSATGRDRLDRDGVPDAGGDRGRLAGDQLLRARTRDARDHAPLLREGGTAERKGANVRVQTVSGADVLMLVSVGVATHRPHAPRCTFWG